ncbi:unnamed protein product, partial [Vitis vinifera]
MSLDLLSPSALFLKWFALTCHGPTSQAGQKIEDEGEDSLLEFHKSRYNAKRGGNVDAMGVLTSELHDGLAAPTLRNPVPVGTVVKRKRGKLPADLAEPGNEILMARGRQGGSCS